MNQSMVPFKKTLAAIALAAVSCGVNAASIEVNDLLNVRAGAGGEFGPTNLSASVSYVLTPPASFSTSGLSAGILDLEVAHDGKSDWQRVLAFCLEPGSLFGYDNPFKVIDNLSTDLKRMWATYFSQIDSGVEAAAFQVAVWELIVDGGTDLGSGGFKLTDVGGAVGSQASVYLNSATWGSGLANLVRLQDNQGTQAERQDLVIEVPTPSGLSLLALGLLGLGMVRRRTVKA